MPFVPANIFQPIIDVFEQVLLFFHDTVGLSWGFSIIAMTVLVRTLMLPLTIKQFRSMQALQQLSPQIKEIQAKYKDDKQRLNQEMMRFYQENKVNPFGSCLPLVLQIPVFIALFYMLRSDLKVDICGPEAQIAAKAEELGQSISNTYCNEVVPGSAQFLFIPDLTAPATGGVLAILIVLYIGSQLLSSLLMSVTADKTQRYIMFALPFVFVFFILNFPAGLLVYWITTNLWTVGQQYFIRRSTGQLPTWLGGDGAAALPAPAPAGARAAAPTPKSGRAAPTDAGPKASPPPPPRKKKKRSGRRR
ncbi:MAG: YidC/Oxa1 family membrane protein insertase [Solirubrobacteraceae bacterium]|nr:YidC/Oxa1 family membrane protein insertase [Solirubrobacteraceae bacterium]